MSSAVREAHRSPTRVSTQTHLLQQGQSVALELAHACLEVDPAQQT
ncbi:MAG: hypothetical protein ACI8W7_004511, partial [Gammaproteobacteria bacterium]